MIIEAVVTPGQPINLTPEQWQIFCHEGNRAPGWQHAGPALNEAANAAVKAYFELLTTGLAPKRAMEHALKTHAVPVMKKHGKHGAYDTEPEVMMVWAVCKATHNDFDRFEVL